MKKPITVVIPNYNGAHLLRKNIPSVMAAVQAYGGSGAIIVVDDGSVDNSLAILKQEFPDVEIVIHEKNKGFAEAIHSGVDAAKTELLFLLNSDVEVQENIFSPLVEYFDDANTFSVNPLIYDEQGKVKRHSWNLRQFESGRLKLLEWDLADAISRRNKGDKLPQAYAHGGSFMVRKSMFLALNGFHPIYKPFYSEDYDLGLRAWRRGWGSYFEPKVHIVHQSVGSIRSNVKFKYIKCIRRRNRYLLEWIHLSSAQIFFSAIPWSILQLLGELLLFDIVNLKGFGLAVLKIPEVMQARNELRLSQKLSLSNVLDQIK
ncbi:MAG: glycosyltransferase [Candidatus Methylopumilus sp.]|jgi:GT2 family glycosyltransferase